MRKKILRTFAATLLICTVLTANALPAFAEGATVTGSDVNLRSGPGTGYSVLDCLPKGASVTVTDRSNSDWTAVTYNGTSGFISSRYLSSGGSGSGSSDGSGSVYSDGVKGMINAMYVRFRSGPSTDHEILGSYNKGKELTITGTSGSWTACVIDGVSGYVSSQYVSTVSGGESAPRTGSGSDDPYAAGGSDGSSGGIVIGGGSSGEEQTPAPATPAPSTSDPYAGGSGGIVVGGSSGESQTPAPSTPVPSTPEPSAPSVEPSETKSGTINGDYVCFRTGPSTSYRVITTYNRGKALTVTGTSGDWTACVIDGVSGYVFSQYVSLSAEPETKADPEPSEPEVAAPSGGSSEPGYITGNNVRLRGGPSMSSEVLDELFYGNTVTITGVTGDWTAVISEGRSGYVFSQYVAKGEYKHVSSGGGSELGREIADYALQFVGYPYTWGGRSPDTGFDCSGLMYYVYQQFGYTLNRIAEDQARNGVHVDPSELQPGDLLCFYSGGSYIGHVGMYIGNNQFVHAANSNMGVIISDLSGYYSSRGYEARRII